MTLTDKAQGITRGDLLDALFDHPEPRVIAALVGPPASGKSTVSEELLTALNDREAGCACLLQMDGFHLDDGLLEARGLLARKGAPETFDVGGLRTLLARVAAGEPDILAPRFDRSLEVSRGSAVPIPPEARIVLVEGNWLLLDQPPWRDLRDWFHVTIALDPPEAVLRERLMARWAALGPDVAARKTEENDLPNARLVRSGSVPADWVLV